MKKLLLTLAFVFLAGIAIFSAGAQGAPGSLDPVLADLSRRVGQTVTADSLDTWTFEQQVFPDTSLGCPQPNQVYAQVQTVGVQYVLTYQGKVYDYRISGDGSTLILCNESETIPPCPPPDAIGYLQPRLRIGEQARVGVGGVPNNVREQAGSSSRLLGEIPSEGVFTVLDGPICTTLDKVVWWQVDYNGLIGWTAESKDGEYFLDPIVLPGTLVPTAPSQPTPTPTPASMPAVLDASNAALVTLLNSPAIENGVYALLPDGESLAVGGADGAVVIYDLNTNAASIPTPAHNGAVTAIVFDMNPAEFKYVLITAGTDGFVRTWELGSGNTLTLVLELMGIQGKVTSLGYSSVGQLVAVGDDLGNVYVFSLNSASPLATLTGHTAPITHVEFSTNGTLILSVDESRAGRVWGIPVAAG